MSKEVNLSLSVPAELNPDGVPLRVLGTAAEPRLVLADLCRVLGNADPSKVATRLDPDEKGPHIVRTPGGPQQMETVNEAGLYHVCLTSRAPNARPFRRWVCHEVLPSIRRHGCYPPPAVAPDDGELAGRIERLEDAVASIAQNLAQVTGLLVRLAEGLPARPPLHIHPEGPLVGIRERIGQRWPGAPARWRDKIAKRVSRWAMQNHVLLRQAVDRAPYMIDQIHLPDLDRIIDAAQDEACEAYREPLFERALALPPK